MAETVPTIAYWCGVPLNEMPREELEREFAKAHETIARLHSVVRDKSVAHIRDLAVMRRREMEGQKSLLGRLLDKIAT